MPTFAINGQLIAAPITYTTASSYLSSRRQYTSLYSSRELRFNSPPPRLPSLTCSSTSSRNQRTEPSSNNNTQLNSLARSFYASAKPKRSSNGSLRKSLAKSLVVTSVSSAASLFLPRLFSLLSILKGGGGGGGDGGGVGVGGGGGGGDGGFWKDLFFLAPVAVADEETSPEWDSHGLPANIVVQLNKLSGLKKYKISDIIFFDRRSKDKVETEDSFFDVVSIQPGGVYTKAQLQSELETLATCGFFDKIDFEGKTNPDGTLGVTFSFVESRWPGTERVRCINVGLMAQLKPVKIDQDMTEKEMIEHLRNQEKDYKRRIEKARPCLLPGSVQREVMHMLRDQRSLSARFLQKVKDRALKWYQDKGYVCANMNIGYLNSKELVLEVVEGDITKLVIQFYDKLGNVVEGHTQIPVVRRQIPKQLRPGHVFNMEVANQAVQNIHSLGLFSNTEIIPIPDEKNEGGLILEIKLKEQDQKSVDVTTDWDIVPGPQGYPSLASLQPGGTVSFQHKNIKGLNRSLMGSVSTSNLLNPEDDLSFQFEYVHPYLDGVSNPRNRTFKTSFFNTSKLSPVFTGGPGFEEGVAPILVDRTGGKATITEDFTRQSKLTYGLVLEEITTRDENKQIASNGLVLLPNGAINVDGPPTTLSGTGTDRVAFLQGNITRDTTKFVNGAIVGDRNIFQVDQGLGIGSKFPLFNRHQLTLTKFIQLMQVEEGPGKQEPPVLVLHSHYGGCVGDLPSYDAFALGGPKSVRGYTMGELGAARNILEVSAEIRVPVKNTHVYAFAEHGNDLGSSKDVKGNPTAVYKRMGHGSSYGVGVKLGQIRAEYVVDHNCGTGALSLQFGERY